MGVLSLSVYTQDTLHKSRQWSSKAAYSSEVVTSWMLGVVHVFKRYPNYGVDV